MASIMKSVWLVVGCACVWLSSITLAGEVRGISANGSAHNYLLGVGVSHGLPGIDIDVDNVEKMASNPAYNFTSYRIMDEKGTIAEVAKELTNQSQKVDADGTFFFYFSGHGSPDSLYMQDGLMKSAEMRGAIQAGRAGLPPLARLVLMFDSCFSGSLLDPWRSMLTFDYRTEAQRNASFAESLVRAFSPTREEMPYWKSLFVFASSKADETSLAGENGSVFTVALKKAFDEVLAEKGSMGSFVEKTKTYTVGHHPVERFVPASLKDEAMLP